MEDVLPLLRRWWADLQSLEALLDFRTKVRTAVFLPKDYRVIERAGSGGSGGSGGSRGGEDGEEDGREGEWGEGRDSSIDMDRMLAAITELSTFRSTRRHSDKAYECAEGILEGNPEQLLNRTVAHIKYLFGVTALEGLLPRMNQVKTVVILITDFY